MRRKPNKEKIAGGDRSLRGGRQARRGAVAVEAAVCLPLIITLMLGMWQFGSMAQWSRVLRDAAREGARVAAGGNNNGSSVTVANVQTVVQNFLTASGMPSTAANGATVTVTNLSSDSWTNPGNAMPLDQFSVTVTIPAGAPFNSLQLVGATYCGITQLQATVNWLSANDTKVSVGSTLPY